MGVEDAVSAYTACIRNHAQLNMIVEYASLGASFRMIEKLANATRKLTGVSKYSGCSQRQVAKVLRVVCASNIQMLLENLGRCWAFSLAFDSATRQSTSYLDLRVRFCFGDNIDHFHVISVPMDGSHTGREMFKIIVARYPGWLRSATAGEIRKNEEQRKKTPFSYVLKVCHVLQCVRCILSSLPNLLR